MILEDISVDVMSDVIPDIAIIGSCGCNSSLI